MTEKHKRRRPMGETLGGIIVGFDQQILRTLPPPHELVQKGAPVRALTGEDGGALDISFPEDRAALPAAAEPSRQPQEERMPSTSDLVDEQPDGVDVCELQFRQYGEVRQFNGRVRTVRCLEDNSLLRALLTEPGQGQVLVVDGGGSFRTALLGDMVAGVAVERGWAGIVVNGCVRDVEALRRLPIGIKALGSNPRRSGKLGTGEVDVPVTFGGATFVPGQTLTSDEDGVVVTRPPGSAG
jgi:regulator of ribonuclease activity A